MAIKIFEGQEGIPNYDKENPFWQVADSDEIKSMALSQIFSELEHDPSRMSDEECRATLAKCHAYFNTAFYRKRLEETRERQNAEDEADQEPQFEEVGED